MADVEMASTDVKPLADAQPEASTSSLTAPVNGADPNANGEATTSKKDDDDEDKIPDDATETLYIQNLNEKVKMPGGSLRHFWRHSYGVQLADFSNPLSNPAASHRILQLSKSPFSICSNHTGRSHPSSRIAACGCGVKLS
jgi:hypothetical protein